MKRLIETNDLVQLSWVEALLRDAGIESLILDSSAAVFGSMPMVQRRLMVADDDLEPARRLLDEAKVDYERK
jgi:Putative prokaryotic signal transducing protein